MHTVIRPTRRRQRGQVIPLIALLGLLLVGATAVAVDLSLQTSNKRQLQNVADSAALAGARDVPSDPSTAVDHALAAVQANMQWSDDLVGLASPCTGYPTTTMTTFHLTGVCRTVTHPGYTITVSTPPMNPTNVVDLDPHDIEVDLTQTESTTFAAAIGFTSATQRAHAVARHGTSGTTLGFALFANGYIQTGNSISVISGNVYAGRAIDLQANGQSALCANRTGTNDDGYIFLGAPQLGDGLAPSSKGQADMQQATSHTITPLNEKLAQACTVDNISAAKLGGYVIQSGMQVQPPSQTCPSLDGVSGVFYNTAVRTCEVTPIVVPPAPEPPQVSNVYQLSGNPCKGGGGGNGSGNSQCWSSNPAPGVYVVTHTNDKTCNNNCWDLEITAPVTLDQVTVILKPGATFHIDLGNTTGLVTWVRPYNAGTGQPSDGRFVVYGESGTSMSLAGQSTTVDVQAGSIYMPDGTVSGSSPADALTLDQGQAVVDNWNVSSGNQQNAQITYSGQYAAVSGEAFRLVE